MRLDDQTIPTFKAPSGCRNPNLFPHHVGRENQFNLIYSLKLRSE